MCVCVFNAKFILLEEWYWYCLTHSWEGKGVHNFQTNTLGKGNLTRREFELAYHDSIVHRFSRYTRVEHPQFMLGYFHIQNANFSST